MRHTAGRQTSFSVARASGPCAAIRHGRGAQVTGRSATVALVLLTAGCHATPPAPTLAPHLSPVTQAAAAPPQVFDDPAAGIRLTYPAGWTARPPISDTTPLRAVAPADMGTAVLTLDVPTLPPHIPGLIPIGLVANGYVSDVKKRMPDATGTPKDLTVPGADARRVTLSGHDDAGHADTDDAVLIVHGDHVYILAVDSDPAGRSAAAAALGAAVKSIHWTR